MQGWSLTYFETFPTSEGNFHLSEMKIHLPKLFWLVLIGRIFCSWQLPAIIFSIKEGSNFTCSVGQVGWEVQLSDSYFQLSRAVGQSLTCLMSIPVFKSSRSKAPFTLQPMLKCFPKFLVKFWSERIDPVAYLEKLSLKSKPKV